MARGPSPAAPGLARLLPESSLPDRAPGAASRTASGSRSRRCRNAAGRGAMAMAETERTMRELGRGVAGPGRRIDVAGVVALTDPGPAAAGIVVTDGQGRMLANRSHYLGTTTRRDAAAGAAGGRPPGPRRGAGGAHPSAWTTRTWCRPCKAAPGGARSGADGACCGPSASTLAQLPGHRLEAIAPAPTGPARSPSPRWWTGSPSAPGGRRGWRCAPLGDGRYEVQSESEPGKVYHVTLRGEPSTSGAPAGGRGRRAGGLRVRRLPLPQHPLQAPLRRRPGDGELRPPLPPRPQRRRRRGRAASGRSG